MAKQTKRTQGPHTLKPLPYSEDALAPAISRRTVRVHHGKHHRGYVDKLNELVRGTELETLSLEETIRRTRDDPQKRQIHNNAAQVWNHDFYWRSLRPASNAAPASGELLRAVEDSFQSFDEMKRRLAEASMAQFGTGWGWLVRDGEHLRVVATEDADNPLTLGVQALLTIDVWEHAYYLDYQNRRDAHVNAVLDSLANWDFAAENLRRAADGSAVQAERPGAVPPGSGAITP